MKTRIAKTIICSLLFFMLCTQVNAVSLKFQVDMSVQISRGRFNATTDKVFIKGSFDNWKDGLPLTKDAKSDVYSIELSLTANSTCEYKYFSTSTKADNGGWEGAVGTGYNGNRTVNIGAANSVLPVVFFNNDELSLRKSSEHFDFYCAAQDESTLNDLSNQLESNYSRIVSSLEATITQKINIEVYKDLKSYHNACGWPDAPDWAVGNAQGKTTILMVSPLNPGPVHTYSSLMEIITHEFVHTTVAWKQTTNVPNWLNEGTAVFYANQIPTRDYLKSLIKTLGRKPELEYLEDYKTFGERGGYSFAYTIPEFVVARHGKPGLAKLIGNYAPTTLGYADKAAFQTEWHKFLDQEYLGITSTEDSELSDQSALHPNFPNPFKQTTAIEYSVASSCNVIIKVYDLQGNEIRVLVNEKKVPGKYTVPFNTEGLSGKTFICTMQAGSFVQSYKMIQMN